MQNHGGVEIFDTRALGTNDLKAVGCHASRVPTFRIMDQFSSAQDMWAEPERKV